MIFVALFFGLQNGLMREKVWRARKGFVSGVLGACVFLTWAVMLMTPASDTEGNGEASPLLPLRV